MEAALDQEVAEKMDIIRWIQNMLQRRVDRVCYRFS